MPILFRTEGSAEYLLRGRAQGDPPNHLMLVHVTSVGAARQILRMGQITMRRCTVFNKDLVYFFVLRPAYKLKSSREKRAFLDYFPFVFALDPALLGSPFHVYPFDTGGAYNGAFDAGHSPWIPMEDYSLSENLQGAADHIAWAFDSRADYFDGRLKANLAGTLPSWDSHGLTTLAIARLAAEGSNSPDLRASSIEVAYAEHIPIAPHIRFAVMPRQFLEDPLGTNTPMLKALQAGNIAWEIYDWRPNRSPEDFQKEINDLVRAWMVAQGAL